MTNFFNSKKKWPGAIDAIGQSGRPMRVKKIGDTTHEIRNHCK